MALYTQKTGKKITYAELAGTTGVSRATIEALGSRDDYNTTLSTIDALCQALRCDINDILEYSSEETAFKDLHGD